MPKLTVEHIEKLADKALDLSSPKRLFRRAPQPVSPQGLTYATFNRRMLASTIDAVLMTFLLLPFNDLILAYAYGSMHVDNAALQSAVNSAATPAEANLAAGKLLLSGGLLNAFGILMQIQFTIMAAYSFLFWHFYGATPGKLLLRMKIVDGKTGKKLNDLQSISRIVGYLVAGLPLLMGFFALTWDRHRRGWHDRMARTVVVVLPRTKGAQAGDASAEASTEEEADSASPAQAGETK